MKGALWEWSGQRSLQKLEPSQMGQIRMVPGATEEQEVLEEVGYTRDGGERVGVEAV